MQNQLQLLVWDYHCFSLRKDGKNKKLVTSLTVFGMGFSPRKGNKGTKHYSSINTIIFSFSPREGNKGTKPQIGVSPL